MSRILLTWELGLNLGHLARLLPVARKLKAQGHTVLVATRDIQAASRVLTPAGIPFVQAPHLPQGLPLAQRPSGYADILLSQGWSNRTVLHGLTHAWLNLFRLFNPERLILDYSPTVSLAARIARLPTLLVGNGFELPPATDPLPAFPGFSWATAAGAAAAEAVALTSANAVLASFGAQSSPLTALRDLMLGQDRVLVTFPELDHYGERADSRYVGALSGDLKVPRVDWPRGTGPRIFACLRPDTRHVQHILGALAGMECRVVCVASGFAATQLEVFKKEHIHFSPGPVDLDCLGDADLCVTYGAEGTMVRFLLAGVPQLISPWHVETFMAARRIETLRAGWTLTSAPTTLQSVRDRIKGMCDSSELKQHAAAFAHRHVGHHSKTAVAALVAAIDTPKEHSVCPNPGPVTDAASTGGKSSAQSGSLS